MTDVFGPVALARENAARAKLGYPALPERPTAAQRDRLDRDSLIVSYRRAKQATDAAVAALRWRAA